MDRCVYAELEGAKIGLRQVDSERIPVLVDMSSNLSPGMKSWIWTVAGGCALAATPEYTMDVLGTRLLDKTNSLDYAFGVSMGGHPLGSRSGTAEAPDNFWDAVAGLKGRANFGADRKWFIPYYVDVGTGQSQLTWQASTGVGYQFGWGSALATWRHLDYSFKSDSKIESTDFNGPIIGVSFHF